MHIRRGEVYTATFILSLGLRWRWEANFMPRRLYSGGNSHHYPLNRRPGGLQSRSRRFRMTEKSLAPAGNRWAPSRVNVQTTQSWEIKNILFCSWAAQTEEQQKGRKGNKVLAVVYRWGLKALTNYEYKQQTWNLFLKAWLFVLCYMAVSVGLLTKRTSVYTSTRN